MQDEIAGRVRRIYAAIGAAEEHDMSRLPGKIANTANRTAVVQDFSGNLSLEQIANLAHSIIQNIANLEHHLRRWADQTGNDKSVVDQTVAGSPELQIIRDLANNEKHGYPPRDGGCSGRAPRVVALRRVFRLTAAPGKSAAMTLGTDGRPVLLSGSGKAVVTGEIVDKNGDKVGDLYDVAGKAVEDWESLLLAYDVQVGQPAPALQGVGCVPPFVPYTVPTEEEAAP